MKLRYKANVHNKLSIVQKSNSKHRSAFLARISAHRMQTQDGIPTTIGPTTGQEAGNSRRHVDRLRVS